MEAGAYVLDQSAQVTLNASGAGTVMLGPTSSRITWNVTSASVRVSSNTREPTANLYYNTRGSFIGGTYTGSNDSTDLDLLVRNGRIVCDWAGGDAGAIATLTVHGQVYPNT
jgi:hypothetical protein